ncbi:MAG TPA: nucleotidyltransferase family protein [Kofleriaceae bacterium]
MKLGAVILAAGAGTRLGGVAKALLVGKRGRTFLASILTTAREVGLDDAIVVVGPPFGDRVAQHARELGAYVVFNREPERGMASSVVAGFSALAAGSPASERGVSARQTCDAAWLWPVDHPDVAAATLEALIAALMNHDAARPVYAGHGGHPPLIARSLVSRLASCGELDGGARTVLAEADTIDVPVDDPGCVRDIDTPVDLEAM